jgi:hypothetical protein
MRVGGESLICPNLARLASLPGGVVSNSPLPDDVDALKALVVELWVKFGNQSQFTDQLLSQFEQRLHHQHGASSERFSLRQHRTNNLFARPVLPRRTGRDLTTFNIE